MSRTYMDAKQEMVVDQSDADAADLGVMYDHYAAIGPDDEGMLSAAMAEDDFQEPDEDDYFGDFNDDWVAPPKQDAKAATFDRGRHSSTAREATAQVRRCRGGVQ